MAKNKTASRMLTERKLRELFERQTGKAAMIDTDRLGRGGRPSSAYATWLEDTVRTWWPELSAMIDRENKKTLERHEAKNRQTTLFNTGD